MRHLRRLAIGLLGLSTACTEPGEEGRSREAAECVGSEGAQVLAFGEDGPGELLLDEEYLYWIAGDQFEGAVRRVPRTGGTVETIVDGMNIPRYITTSEDKLYVSDLFGNQIIMADKEEGATKEVVASGNDAETPRDIDVGSGTVVWAMDYGLRAMPDGGGAITTLEGFAGLNQLAVDDRVYYTLEGEGDSTLRIRARNLDGSGLVTLAEITPGSSSELELGPDDVFILSGGSFAERTIYAVGRDGTNLRSLVTAPWLTDIAYHDGFVYFSSIQWEGECGGVIGRVSVDGGAVEVLVDGLDQPYWLAVDDCAIYWTVPGGGNGMVLRWERPDGECDGTVTPPPPSGTCGDGTLTLGVPVTGRLSGDDFDAACDAGLPDAAYMFTAPATATYEFSTVGSDFDTVLGLRAGCDGAEFICRDDWWLAVPASVITVQLAQGQTIVAVVSGYKKATGDFVLGVERKDELGFFACQDGADNDGDGDADCMDRDCGCQETSGDVTADILCTDGVDNDNDGALDCADRDCGGLDECGEAHQCLDNYDNDDDGLLDCEDNHCVGTPACGSAVECAHVDLGSEVGAMWTGRRDIWTYPYMSCSGSSGGVIFAFTAPADGTYGFDASGSDYVPGVSVHDGSCAGPELVCALDAASVTLSAGQSVAIFVTARADDSDGKLVLTVRD